MSISVGAPPGAPPPTPDLSRLNHDPLTAAVSVRKVAGTATGFAAAPSRRIRRGSARGRIGDNGEMVARWLLCGLALAPTPVQAVSTPLDAAVASIGEMSGVRTVHVWRGDELLAARAFRGADFGPHDVKSLSKSVLSALIGIALERRILPGLDAPIAELLPEESSGLDEERRRGITLRHLLTMTSGLGSTSGEHYGRWVASRNWVRAALGRPLEAAPGERFVYSTGNSHLLAAALTRAVGEDLLAWSRRVLFDPLGLEVAGWDRDPQGIRFGGNSFRITPEALGRFGRLYARGGRHRGAQLVPARWIEESTRGQAAGWPERYGAYGYLWWVPPFATERAFLAAGYGGQFLLVVPERDLVVVLTSSHVGKGEPWDRELLRRLEHELLPVAAAVGGSQPATRRESRGKMPRPERVPEKVRKRCQPLGNLFVVNNLPRGWHLSGQHLSALAGPRQDALSSAGGKQCWTS